MHDQIEKPPRRSNGVRTKPQWLDNYVSRVCGDRTVNSKLAAFLVESASNSSRIESAKQQYNLPSLLDLVSYAILSQHNVLLAD